MALSYSAWKTWDQCAAKYRYSYVEKLPRGEMGAAAQRGTEIHESVDRYFQGKSDEVHPEIKGQYGQWFMQMRNYPTEPEYKWAVDENWQLVAWESPEATWRGVIDLRVTPSDEDKVLDLYEWKTGNIYSDHAFQAELYGLIGLSLTELVDLVRVTNVYFDKNKVDPREFERKNLEGLQILWDHKHYEVTNDEIFAANPGWYCRYCNFSKSEGGPCQF